MALKTNKKQIVLIGVGVLGIRHLEGLLTMKKPVTITAVELVDSLREKAAALPNPNGHTLIVVPELPQMPVVDLAIIATTSAHRAGAVRTLIERVGRVHCMILEKVLFDDPKEYAKIGVLLKKHRIKTWVNHPRRMYPFHKKLAESERGKKFFYHIHSGIQNGLTTNLTHFVDYFAHVARSLKMKVDVSLISTKTLPSKRAGYLDVFGTISVTFPNGSVGMATCLPHTAPFGGEFMNATTRITFDETAGTAEVSQKRNGWKWEHVAAPLTYQSAMTGPLSERILKTGTCDLPTYDTSARIHLAVFEPLRRKLGITRYQFT